MWPLGAGDGTLTNRNTTVPVVMGATTKPLVSRYSENKMMFDSRLILYVTTEDASSAGVTGSSHSNESGSCGSDGCAVENSLFETDIWGDETGTQAGINEGAVDLLGLLGNSPTEIENEAPQVNVNRFYAAYAAGTQRNAVNKRYTLILVSSGEKQKRFNIARLKEISPSRKKSGKKRNSRERVRKSQFFRTLEQKLTRLEEEKARLTHHYSKKDKKKKDVPRSFF